MIVAGKRRIPKYSGRRDVGEEVVWSVTQGNAFDGSLVNVAEMVKYMAELVS